MNTRTSAFPDDTFEPIDETPSRLSVDRVMHSIRNFATLSEALRILGAGVLLASMSVFLLQGWSEGNDIRRYLLLLAQTGLLGAAGFAFVPLRGDESFVLELAKEPIEVAHVDALDRHEGGQFVGELVPVGVPLPEEQQHRGLDDSCDGTAAAPTALACMSRTMASRVIWHACNICKQHTYVNYICPEPAGEEISGISGSGCKDRRVGASPHHTHQHSEGDTPT